MLIDALLSTFAPFTFLFLAIGVLSGIVVGAIPGLSGSMLIALSVPLTYHMTSGNAVALLVAMYVGSIAGGLISATLLRMPGTPSAVVTTLDGYPMAKAGQPHRALALGISASFAGGLIAWVALALLSRPLSVLALHLTAFNFFALVMTAIVLIASIGGRDVIKGLIAGFLGMLLSMPGVDPSIGQLRLTFGVPDLANGFQLLPVLVGAFAISQILKDTLEVGRATGTALDSRGRLFLPLRVWRRNASNMARSSLIGTLIGILPGVGAAVGSMIAYAAAKFSSKEPERFGTGHEAGVIAAEAGNSSTVGGALIPLVALGIPGSVIDAILIGALMIHQIQPGPMLFTRHPDIVWGLIAANLVATVLMFIFLVLLTPTIARLAQIRPGTLLPVIFVLCVAGTFALGNSFFDVWVMLAFGALGFIMERAGFSLGPFVIGFVLAPVAEQNLRQGLMISNGDVSPLFTDPLSLCLLTLSLVLLVWPFLRGRKFQKKHG
ncbi:tripartite tricarboxylate transporter permease [Sedimentitalea sp.]|uniref:tripartite tricarboxylate transporter permease n=1 Tax=Sedimentitalea sp. TaxID=2048915 RepID=UPI0032987945